MVSGHVDGTASIVRIEKAANTVYYDLKLDPSLAKMLVLKGSIAVDGVSLTIFGLTEDQVTVSLIPHTLDETIFLQKGRKHRQHRVRYDRQIHLPLSPPNKTRKTGTGID